VQNNYIKENVCDKIVTEIPDYSGEMLITKLKEAIIINWNGLYSHKPDSGENMKVDWVDSVGYKRVAAPKKPTVFRGDWIFVADHTVSEGHLRLLQADSCRSLDSPFAKIMAHPLKKDGGFVEETVLGEATLTLEQVFQMFFKNIPDDQLMGMDIADVVEKVSYSQETMEDWSILLKYGCGISQGYVYIDELTFQSKRYGFNPAQARTDMQAIDAAYTIQRCMRRFVAKVRHGRLYRIPGYAIATGVYMIESVYLVYIFRASSDQRRFTLTVKERDDNHDR